MPLTPKETAELIMSVGTKETERPLTPIEVASRIKSLLEEYGSRKEVARRLGLKGTDMVSRFISLLDLPPTVREVVGWKGPSEGELGLDMAYRVSTLGDPRERDLLAKVILQESLKKQEVFDILTIRNNNPNMTIEECIELTLKLRPVEEIGYLLAFELSTDAESQGTEEIKRMLEDVIDKQEIESIRVRGRLVVLVVSETGYVQLSEAAESRGIDKRKLMQGLLGGRTEN